MTLLEFATAIADFPELTELEQRLLPQLVDVALAARRAGVRPRLERLAVSRLELEAWAAAGVRYDVELAQRHGLAAQGPRGIALAQVELDGGDAADEQLLDAAAAALARRC